MRNPDLQRALEEQEGNAKKAAALIGVSPQAWGNWKTRGLPKDAETLIRVAVHPKGRAVIQRVVTELGKGGVP